MTRIKDHTDAPPHDSTAEQFLIGALILAPDKLRDLSLREADLYVPAHRRILQAVCEVYLDGGRPDLATVLAALGDDADRLRGEVLDVLSANASAANIVQYEATVIRLAEQRRAIEYHEKALIDARAGVFSSNGTSSHAAIARQSHWTASELMAADFPEPKWAVEGVIPEGLTLLAAPPKFGKSWLALGLGLAIASGSEAFGRIPVQQGNAMVLALEDTARRLKERMAALLHGEPVPEGLHLWTSYNGIEELRKHCLEHQIRYLGVDVLRKVRPAAFRGESAYDSDYRAIEPLKELADECGMAVLVLHHDRKATSEDFVDNVSGTNGLAGAADTVIVMGRSRMTKAAEMHITGRDVPEAKLALSFDEQTGQWSLEDAAALLAPTRARILTHLQIHGALPPKAISDALGLDHELVKKTAQRMHSDHQLAVQAGRYFDPCTPVPPVPESLLEGQRDMRDTHTHGTR